VEFPCPAPVFIFSSGLCVQKWVHPNQAHQRHNEERLLKRTRGMIPLSPCCGEPFGFIVVAGQAYVRRYTPKISLAVRTDRGSDDSNQGE